ncbi:MAG: Helix-turn-helix domain [Acidobacteriota bacterium]|jgi:transcriptional regulator with XRE-family HTH domain|nr:Helix-turn-helix domain [Acidobacteriota bacterium]
MTIGERIREARTAQHLSLTVLSHQLDVSAATLSRIENGKQSLDVSLFLLIAKTLRKSPDDLLAEAENGHGSDDELVLRIGALGATKRTQLWRELAASRRTVAARARTRDLAQDIEELLAQVDFIRDEIDSMRGRMRARQR